MLTQNNQAKCILYIHIHIDTHIHIYWIYLVSLIFGGKHID